MKREIKVEKKPEVATNVQPSEDEFRTCEKVIYYAVKRFGWDIGSFPQWHITRVQVKDLRRELYPAKPEKEEKADAKPTAAETKGKGK